MKNIFWIILYGVLLTFTNVYAIANSIQFLGFLTFLGAVVLGILLVLNAIVGED